MKHVFNPITNFISACVLKTTYWVLFIKHAILSQLPPPHKNRHSRRCFFWRSGHSKIFFLFFMYLFRCYLSKVISSLLSFLKHVLLLLSWPNAMTTRSLCCLPNFKNIWAWPVVSCLKGIFRVNQWWHTFYNFAFGQLYVYLSYWYRMELNHSITK